MASSIKIEGLTKVQANFIGILLEDGDLQNFLNEQIEERKMPVDEFKEARMDFDEGEFSVDHTAILD